ncbi:MAG TPA: hypothetical protein DEA08_28570, partial [Planctomycetes bacterium]|nr:hypothetical protein [Planctomycetota bacterium]
MVGPRPEHGPVQTSSGDEGLIEWLQARAGLSAEQIAQLRGQCAQTGLPLREQALGLGLIDSATLAWLERLPAGWSGAVPPPALGRYLLERELGRGGMGVVYQAFDPQLGRRVAIKQLLPRDEGPVAARARERFAREARACATLSHRNLVPVYEVGELGGEPFLVMELVAGETLEQALARDPSIRQVVSWVQQVAEAVGVAHAAGIVHRDLKPGNVLIEREGGAARLTDFGLARDLSLDVQLTHAEALVGTPAFMSPEQAAREQATPASDVFSLGAVLYHALSGRLPFGGNEEGLAEVLVAIASLEPPPLRQVAARVPVDLQTVVQRCLEKEPA